MPNLGRLTVYCILVWAPILSKLGWKYHHDWMYAKKCDKPVYAQNLQSVVFLYGLKETAAWDFDLLLLFWLLIHLLSTAEKINKNKKNRTPIFYKNDVDNSSYFEFDHSSLLTYLAAFYCRMQRSKEKNESAIL